MARVQDRNHLRCTIHAASALKNEKTAAPIATRYSLRSRSVLSTSKTRCCSSGSSRFASESWRCFMETPKRFAYSISASPRKMLPKPNALGCPMRRIASASKPEKAPPATTNTTSIKRKSSALLPFRSSCIAEMQKRPVSKSPAPKKNHTPNVLSIAICRLNGLGCSREFGCVAGVELTGRSPWRC